ncbi:ER membrane protein complex subunit 10 [Dorcoceras hygrometricum]|uniref:ER membrane protein complex subunit 10 n=1 Tax=Dorcoceras hygrometricum TaxID=472368 RepID=A0A2Z7CSD5_9LAMI|nr:ER membrane protein complex subunit 10 [Dorcoceras hygrometricum]
MNQLERKEPAGTLNQQLRTSSRKMMYQSQALQDQRLDNQSQHNEKKNQMRSCCKGKRFYTSRLDCKGAKTRRRKETAVARSVVTKKRQQLSEQLLNNLLENIQLLDAINAQDGRING